MNMIKRMGIAIGIAAVAVMTLAPLAMAGIVSSDHDMIFKNTYSGANAKAGTCSFCHIPHKAGGAKLWSSIPEVGTGWRAETVSQLCYSCHGYATYLGANELNPFEDAAHGRTVATLTGYGDATTTELSTGGVPLSAGDSNLKCTSCHDVHNNDTRPFIRFGTAGTFAFNTFCEKCHIHRANAIGQETANIVPNASSVNYSQHPTDQLLATSGDNAVGFGTIAGQFNVIPAASFAQPGVAGVHGWNLGGHRTDGTAAGNIGCSTCHAVHGNETTDFASATDGGTPVSPANPPTYYAMAVLNPNPGTSNAAICVGCHTATMPIGPGVGGTSHPIGTLSAAWTITGVDPAALTTSMGAKWGSSAGSYVLVCQSCHKMHYAATNTSLLRGTIDSPTPTSNSNCNACHAASTQGNHHPAGVVYSGIASPVTQTTAMTWSTFTKGTAGQAYEFAAGNVMTCATCHAGAAQAHNNASGFPALAGFNDSSEMCFDCHTENPSTYTANSHPGTLEAGITDTSHYVGTIQTSTYKRTAAWTNTRLSKWGDAGAAIICESCHTLKFRGIVPAISSNVAVANAVKGSVGLLLEASGNNNTAYHAVATDTNGTDLCTGCHGGQPTGGSTGGGGTATHPAVSTGYAGPVPAAITTRMGTMAAGTVTLNSAATPVTNCESCHRPHDAAQGSGALILEGITATGSNKVFNDRATANGGANYANETDFCNMCHNF